MMKRIGVFAAAAILLFLAADYLGWAGTRVVEQTDFHHMTFATVDAASGASIDNVHVNCMRAGSRSACTERRGNNAGEVRMTLSVIRRVERGRVFSREAGISLGSDGRIRVLFIHPHYEPLWLELGDADLRSGATATRRVALRASGR